MEFRHWLYREFADFGFDSDRRRRGSSQGNPSGTPDGTPDRSFDADQIMTELNRLPPIGPVKGKRKWQDVIEWGEQVGAMKVNISPYGSYKVITRRKIHDLQGEERWICKNVFSLNDRKYSDMNESSLAHHLYETVQEISQNQIDRAENRCSQFEKICWGVANKTKLKHPEVMLFRGMKQINENYYTVFFEYRGHGLEAPNSKRVEQFSIDMLFDPKIGLMRSMGYEITSPVKQHLWQVTPSEWDEYFTPTQNKDEIIESICTLLQTY